MHALQLSTSFLDASLWVANKCTKYNGRVYSHRVDTRYPHNVPVANKVAKVKKKFYLQSGDMEVKKRHTYIQYYITDPLKDLFRTISVRWKHRKNPNPSYDSKLHSSSITIKKDQTIPSSKIAKKTQFDLEIDLLKKQIRDLEAKVNRLNEKLLENSTKTNKPSETVDTSWLIPIVAKEMKPTIDFQYNNQVAEDKQKYLKKIKNFTEQIQELKDKLTKLEAKKAFLETQEKELIGFLSGAAPLKEIDKWYKSFTHLGFFMNNFTELFAFSYLSEKVFPNTFVFDSAYTWNISGISNRAIATERLEILKNAAEGSNRRFVAIPIDVGNHITLTIIDRDTKSVIFYDPQAIYADDRKLEEHFRMSQYLDFINDTFFDDEGTILQNPIKHQHDKHNCGAFILVFFYNLLSNISNDPDLDIEAAVKDTFADESVSENIEGTRLYLGETVMQYAVDKLSGLQKNPAFQEKQEAQERQAKEVRIQKKVRISDNSDAAEQDWVEISST